MGDGGELKCALDDAFGIYVTVQSYCEKQFFKKTLQKMQKFADCCQSI